MSTIKSSAEDLTLNADGSGNDIKFQSNGVEKASLTDGGVFTATSFAGSGANLTGVGVDGIVSNANATAITITSAERVGINKTAPDGKLEVLGGGETALVVKTANSGEYAAVFQSVTTNRTPILEVRNNGGGSAFRVQGNDETVIGDSGWGTLPQNAEETLLVTRNGAVITTIFAGENSSARDAILQLQTRNTAAQQRIRFLNGPHAAGTGSGQIHYNPDGHYMAFDANASERFRITANGVTFNGDTAAANALDDYEEGSWTPNISAVNGGTTATYGTNNSGTYTKIGNTVFFSGFLQLNNKGNLQSGAVFIKGLPFIMNTTQANQGSGATVVEYGNFNTNFNSFVLGYLRYDRLGLRYTTGSGTSVYTNVVESAMGQDAYFRFHGQYNV